MDEAGRTQFMTDPGTSGDTANTCCGKHGRRMAALILLLFFLVCRSARGSVVVTLVSIGVTK